MVTVVWRVRVVTSVSRGWPLTKVGNQVTEVLLLFLVAKVTFVEAKAVEMCVHLAVIVLLLDVVDGGGLSPGNESVSCAGNPWHQGYELSALAELGSVLNPDHLDQAGIDEPHPVADNHVGHGDVELVASSRGHSTGGDVGWGEVADNVGVQSLKELPVGLTCVPGQVDKIKKRVLIDFVSEDLEHEIPDISHVPSVVVELLSDEAEGDVPSDEVKEHLQVIGHLGGGAAQASSLLGLTFVPGQGIPCGVSREEGLELVITTIKVLYLCFPLVQRVQGLDLAERPWHRDLGHVLLPGRVRNLRDVKGGVARIVNGSRVTVSVGHLGLDVGGVLDEAEADVVHEGEEVPLGVVVAA